MKLFTLLALEDDIYKFRDKKKFFTKFYTFFEKNEMSDLLKSSYENISIEENILVKFIDELEIFPIFAHILSHELNISVSNISNKKEIVSGYYHQRVEINNKIEFYEYIRFIYLDSFSGYPVIISTEEEIETHYYNKDKYAQFVLDLPDDKVKRFFIVLSHDGDGYDFISNFKKHPYKKFKMING